MGSCDHNGDDYDDDSGGEVAGNTDDDDEDADDDGDDDDDEGDRPHQRYEKDACDGDDGDDDYDYFCCDTLTHMLKALDYRSKAQENKFLNYQIISQRAIIK